MFMLTVSTYIAGQIKLLSLAAAAAFFLTVMPGMVASETPVDAHKADVEEWHKGRIERLKSNDGFLTLVGLFQLETGENRFGSGEDNDLVFPAKAPADAGVLTVKDDTAWIAVNENVEITCGGEIVREAKLISDAEEGTTFLDMGSFRFYVIDRSGSLYIRLKDRESETLAQFKGVDRFPVDASWRFEGRFEPYDPPKTIVVVDVLGNESEVECKGRVAFDVGGDTYYLEPTSASEKSMFFVFGDETSAIETYGGGRFLVTGAPSVDGTVILDFNKAYNPPCVFTPYATCPLPHPANRLAIRIEAGELTWGDHH